MTWIALIRGINVGGNNILPMAELRELLNGLGYSNVKTYIQSGNCLFHCGAGKADQISDQISDAIEIKFGFRPRVMTITAETIDKAIANNPFPQAAEIPKSLYMFFMTETPKAIDDDLLTSIQMEDESFAYIDHVFYLHAPNGMWKSKIGARVEKILGVPMTARNFNTVQKLSKMV